ncbi:hypothetical protein [Humisphaera borealis]|uniref:Uncharacterized protein n=1 Tax=Humisphaera borealis TaxID=2807512 RepID=A0A7M2WZL8_9BACT|nr:hypothetical protein [Humisphaera borealis]QOV90948.1 hypothetical protein IPV69_06190 [Humisphaera borealis]
MDAIERNPNGRRRVILVAEADPNEHRRIIFVAADGRRKRVRLGKCSERDAEQICRHLEALARATIHGQPLPSETAVWVGGIGGKLHDRLARAGLVTGRPAVGRARQFFRAAMRFLVGADD